MDLGHFHPPSVINLIGDILVVLTSPRVYMPSPPPPEYPYPLSPTLALTMLPCLSYGPTDRNKQMSTVEEPIDDDDGEAEECFKNVTDSSHDDVFKPAFGDADECAVGGARKEKGATLPPERSPVRAGAKREAVVVRRQSVSKVQSESCK